MSAGPWGPAETESQLRPEPVEDAAEARLIRHVRWRLVAWSGGTTLVVLLLLGTAIYAATANSLTAAGRAQLQERARPLRDFVSTTRRGGGPPPTDLTFGATDAGTFAFLVAADGSVFGPRRFDPPAGLPDPASVEAARAGGSDVREIRVQGIPVRVLSTAASGRFGDVVIQVVQDRVAEQRTLNVLLLVLVGGGLAAVLVATGVGALYARRALVPIRTSLVAQRQALRRQREFAADASHELRTPLAVVRGSVEHLRRHADRPVADVATALDDIDAEAVHLTSIVEDLLLLARSDSGALDMTRLAVELGDLTVDASSALVTVANAHGVRIEVDPAPCPMLGDPERMRQLVTILVDNAIKHSPRGGTVRVNVRAEGGAATLVVQDEGPGIQEADLPRVFDRFWRASGEPTGGTGLGLAIASTVVERHGGRITAGNVPGAGARFTVILPLLSAPALPSSPAASARLAERGGSERH